MYLSFEEATTTRKIYQKTEGNDVKIEYENDGWKIFDYGQSPKELLALQMAPTQSDVCLSDTMHINWANPSLQPFRVKHRCKGKHDLFSKTYVKVFKK